MEKYMRDFIIYEHIYGLPEYLDAEAEEITELVKENHYTTEKDVEWYVNWINRFKQTDRFGRKRNLYVYWLN